MNRSKEYRVLDYEADLNRRRELLHTVHSRASSPTGFLRLFYSLYPKAPRRQFEVALRPYGADIYSRLSDRIVLAFVETE